MINRTVLAAASALALGLATTAAHSAIVVSLGGTSVAGQGQTSVFSGSAGYTTIDFNSTALGTLPATYTGNGRVVVGSLAGQYAVPQTPANPNTSRYLAVPTAGVGSVTIAAPTNSDYFGLWLGSVDNYNTLSFMNGSTTVFSLTGADIRLIPNPDLTPGTQSEAVYVNFRFSGADQFTSVVLTSSSFAFESDNHVFGVVGSTTVVPVPGAAALMLSGLFGMLFASRRDRKAVQVA